MAHEEWRSVVGYEGLYEVSSLGRLRSLDRTTEANNRWGNIAPRKYSGRLLKSHMTTNSYESRVFARGEKHHLVHRLVAEAFIPNPMSLSEVNHKNGVRSDNRVANLEWVTSSENKRHSYNELGRKQHGKTIPVRLSNESETRDFPSCLAASEYLNRAAGSVVSALHKGHLCAGYAVTPLMERELSCNTLG